MNNKEFISELSKEMGLSASATTKLMGETIKIFEEHFEHNDVVNFSGFGTFEVKERGERTGRNPATGEEIVIPAAKHPAFSAGKALK